MRKPILSRFQIILISLFILIVLILSYKYWKKTQLTSNFKTETTINSDSVKTNSTNQTFNIPSDKISKSGYFNFVDKTPIDNLNHINKEVNPIKYIVIHGTGDYSCNHGYNISKDKYDANRQFFSHYADTVKRTASWHFTIDDTGISQLLSLNQRGYHASNKEINSSSIGIEICINHYKNAEIFNKTLLNTKKIVSELKILYPNAIIIRHHDADLKNHKNCPEIWTDDQWKVISKFFDNENSTLNLDFLKNYTKLKVEWKNGKETSI